VKADRYWTQPQKTWIVINAAWSAAWSDFLSNRVALAKRRAAPFLHALPTAIERGASSEPSTSVTESLVTLANLAHIVVRLVVTRQY
jgi:hypothetical protein